MIQSRFLLWASALVASLVLLGLVIRVLALEGVPLSEGLVLRGAVTAGLAMVFARHRKWSLKPRSMKTQSFRALLAGLALTLFSVSYYWLSASAVSVLSNIDVPLLIVLGPWVGVPTQPKTRLLSLASIAFLCWYVTGLEVQTNLLYGLVTLGLAVVMLCFGYAYIKKSMTEENEAITILVPALALVLYGVGERLVFGGGTAAWTPGLLFLNILSGGAMFGAYYASMRLYAVTDLATAELPSLLSSIAIQPFEAFFLKEEMKATYLLSSVGFVVLTYFIVTYQNQAKEVVRAE